MAVPGKEAATRRGRASTPKPHLCRHDAVRRGVVSAQVSSAVVEVLRRGRVIAGGVACRIAVRARVSALYAHPLTYLKASQPPNLRGGMQTATVEDTNMDIDTDRGRCNDKLLQNTNIKQTCPNFHSMSRFFYSRESTNSSASRVSDRIVGTVRFNDQGRNPPPPENEDPSSSG